MQDRLEMLTKDLKNLLENDSLTDTELTFLKNHVKWYLESIYEGEDWQTRKIAFFNEDRLNDDEVNLSDLCRLLERYQVPYFYYSDGDWEYDDIEVYHCPTFSKQNITALSPRNYNGYAVTLSQLNDLKDLDAETFKQEVFRLATEPFSALPSLEDLAE